MQEQLSEFSNPVTDSFNSSSSNDELSNVATYKAIADSNIIGASLPHTSFLTNSSTAVTIKDYLARPLLLYDDTFTTYNVTPDKFRFAYDYLRHPTIQNKLQHFSLVRGTFSIKLIATAPPYATGILSMSSQYDEIDRYGVSTTDTETLVAHLAQKTHVNLDLGSSNSSSISIPFHFRTPYIQNSNPNIDELKRMLLFVYTLVPLYNSQENTSVKIYYKLYVSLNDAEVIVPTTDIGSYTSEITQTQRGPISYPASIISTATATLSKIPYIGKFAMATSLASHAIGEIAKLFGFSRPRDISPIPYPHEISLASGMGELRSKNLTLDPKQEVTIDNTLFGESNDVLSFQNIVGRYGLIRWIPWLPSSPQNTTIFSTPVSPMSVWLGPLRTYAPTPLAYGSMLFKLWRGSITYKIVIPANRFVRGKLRVFWHGGPIAPGDLSTVSNNTLSLVIDVTSSTEIEINVPWLSNNQYKTIGMLNETFDASVNGFLHFRVEEPLIVNNASYQQPVIIYAKAGPDFELALPDPRLIQDFQYEQPNLSYEEYPIVNFPVTSTNVFAPTSDSSFNYGQDLAVYTALQDNDNNPVLSIVHNLLPDYKPNTDPSVMQVGERYNSFRVMLKRFYPYNIIASEVSDPLQLDTRFVPYLPNCTLSGIQNEAGTVGHYIFFKINTPLQHLSKMFAGCRGSTRYSVTPTIQSDATGTTFVTRAFGQETYKYLTVFNSINNYIAYAIRTVNGFASFKNTEPVVFDIPYQNYHWFYPTVKRPVEVYLDSSLNGTPRALMDSYGAYVSHSAYSPTTSIVHSSIGEDFTFCIYNGPPLIAHETYYEFYHT